MNNNILITCLLALLISGCSTPEPEQPNIIFLLADDHRWDALGCMGNPTIQTPNIDRIAAEGIIFENAYVTTSICAVSRASILAGQYASRTGIHDFATPFSAGALEKTYPAILKDAGYYTGFIGKYGVGNIPPDTLFDYWEAMCGQPGYEHFDEDSNLTHYTRIVGGNIQEFLGSAPADKPFCLSVSFKAPHVQDGDPRQFIYDPAYKDLYKDDSIPLPLTAGDEFFEVFPEEFRNNNEARRRWELRFPHPEKYEESVRGYYRLITGIDVVVGEMIEKLREIGKAENTILIYTGDNGFYLGEHAMAGKWYGHEESIRVPLIIYDPRPQGIKGKRKGEIALNIDIAPTILSVCNQHIPENMQGENLMELFDDEPDVWRKDFLYEHLFAPNPDWGVHIPMSEGVVSANYKYLKYIELDPVFEELYDLREDPYETNNLVSDPGSQQLLDSMKNRYFELKKLYQ